MKFKRNSIAYALRKFDLELLRALLSKNDGQLGELHPSIITNLCKTPLLTDANFDSDKLKQILDCLIKNGVDLSTVKYHNKTCLMLAVQWSFEISKQLIDGGVDLNVQDNHGHTALYHAITGNAENALDIVSLLLNNNVDPNIGIDDNILHSKDRPMLELFLQKSNMNSIHFDKILLHTVESYKPDIAEYLLQVAPFSNKRIITACECLGFNAVLHEEFDKAYQFWKKSLALRNDETSPLPKPKPTKSWGNYVECETVAELDELYSQHKVCILIEAVLQMERYKYCKLEKVFICFSNLRNLDISMEQSLELLEYLIMNYSTNTSFMNRRIFSCIIEILVDLRKGVSGSTEPLLLFEDVMNISKMLTNQLPEWSESSEQFCGTIMPFFAYLIFLIRSTCRNETDFEAAKSLVRVIASEYSKISCEDTLLHIAAGTYDLKTMDILLQCGSFIDAENSSGNTPLYVAIKYRDMDAIQFLLAHGAHFDRRCSEGIHLDTLLKQRTDCSIHIIFNLTSLQCLCAKTIQSNSDRFNMQPMQLALEHFIKLH